MSKDSKFIKIFDTTLRDGEQSPGATMNMREKLKIAQQLAKLKVDIVEAGFPIASPGDFEAVRLVAREVEGTQICALARCRRDDIERAAEALMDAKNKRIHVFVATSEIHRKFKLKKAKEEIIQVAVDSIKYARSLVKDIEFSAEDAARTEAAFLAEVVEAAINAGASTVNIPDTVGYTFPSEFAQLIQYLFKHVPNIHKSVISVHCHNDLGMAVANSLEAVKNGVQQVECTINGLGERAGNCSLEEVVMALRTRKDIFNVDTRIDTKEIFRTSRLVSHITGIHVQPNKAIVGANAFAHEAGIHQDGMLKNRATYEIMDPKEIGWGESELVLGKHSGRHALSKRLEALGYKLTPEEIEKAYERFVAMCDRKKVVYDQDIASLVESEIFNTSDLFELKEIRTNYKFLADKAAQEPVADVSVYDLEKKKKIKGSAQGDGPVDAIYKAIDQAMQIEPTLLDYTIRSITKGRDALGEVSVKISVPDSAKKFMGKGTSPDILEASAKAYLQAINNVFRSQKSNRG